MEINLKFKINLTSKQKEAYNLFHKEEVRELVLNFSRQSGKTTLCEILLIETLITKKCTCAYISPDFAQGKKVFREIVNLLSQTQLIKKKNSSDLTLELINGSYLQFFSAKNPTAIRGNTISGLLVLDEAAYLPEETADGQNFYHMVVKPVTKAKKPKVIFVSTPNGKFGLFYQKYLEGLTSETTKTIECNIYTDSTISKEEIDELKTTTPPLAFRQEFLVEFLDSALTVFEGFEKQFIDYQRVTFNKMWMGVDLSSVGEDETVITKTNGKYVWQKVIKGTLDSKYRQIADIINNSKKLVMCYIEANGIGSPMINEIEKLIKNKSRVLEYITTNENKAENVGNLQLAIAQDNIFFNNEDKDLYRQLGLFSYKVNKVTHRITYAAVPGAKDDRVMSLMIARRAMEDYPVNSASSNYSFVATRKDRI